ncbi:MAG: FtsB family cell division protein [Lachnospiraceae bacterium]|uniref:FtsB family cell division protein n=1 Tax=Parablautia sp. Marseille-Q6255 TaxID=3039593 RepID=UPI0024BD07AE|nr:septum formation initiator family protein [Parablautia sp. Marseille-Q6255]
MAKRRRRPSTGNRRGMVAIAGIVMVLLVGLLMQSQKLSTQNAAYEAQKKSLEQQLRDEELRAAEIENLKEYVQSDEYIENIARDKLGLVFEDEILFQAED